MDPITTAIENALPALVVGAAKTSVKDAYDGLKAVIRRKWGEEGALTQAVTALEADPHSEACTGALARSVENAKATEDAEVVQALARLVDELKKEGIGGAGVSGLTVTITGGVVQGVVSSNRVSVGSMTFGAPSSNKS